jgi:2-amino-4-hydroxy-6-hydroxymethyldihydropteridine diphosphokinase
MIAMSREPMLIGLGANLPSEAGPPVVTLEAALERLASTGIITLQRSRWFMTRPVPASDQPWFVNGVASVRTGLDPVALLNRLHDVEAGFGRVRGAANAARTLDLDLLAYGDLVVMPAPGSPPGGLVLPHPRMHERAFVLLPLADIAPSWHHPVTGRALSELIGDLDASQLAQPLQ